MILQYELCLTSLNQPSSVRLLLLVLLLLRVYSPCCHCTWGSHRQHHPETA
jgi:hypothetical protein